MDELTPSQRGGLTSRHQRRGPPLPTGVNSQVAGELGSRRVETFPHSVPHSGNSSACSSRAAASLRPKSVPVEEPPARSLLIIGFGELAVLVWWGWLGLLWWVFWVGWWRWRGSLGAVGGFWGSRRG